MSDIFHLLLQAVSGMLYQEVLVLQVRYMTDRFQEWRKAGVFKRMWIDGLAIDKKLGSIGNGRLCMDGVITKAPLEGKKYRTKSLPQTELNQVQNVVF